jgi:negative regulator of flagellin synthesis FlgM
MKISSQNSGLASSTPLSKAGVQEVVAKPAAPATVEASIASHVQTASNTTAAEAPFDSQRVAEIRQAIAEGRFQVNPEKIAGQLLSGVRELLGRQN